MAWNRIWCSPEPEADNRGNGAFNNPEFWFGVASDTLIKTVQQTIDPDEYAGEGYGVAPIGHIVKVESAETKTVTVKTNIVFDVGYGWSNLQSSINDVISNYLLELRKSWADNPYLVVRISQIETRLLSIKGIVDIGNTKINGASDNLTLGKFEVPVFGGASAWQEKLTLFPTYPHF